MKKIKLFLAAIAAMVTMGVNAQSWTGNEVANGTFYLYNVGAQKFLNNGDPLQNWGTNAYLQAGFGLDVVIAEVSEGVYTIDTNVSNGGNDHYLGNSTWCDKPATNWTFRAVDGETNTYQIIYDGQYLMANEGLNDVEVVGDPGSRTASTYWKLVTEDDFKAAMQAKTYSTTDPMDVSVFIKGRSFARNDGRNGTWTTTHNGGNWTWIGGSDNKYYGNEAWNNTFDVHQEITGLPDGTYEVQCSGFGTNGTTYVYGNTTMGQLQTDNSTSRGNSKEAKWKAIHEDNAFAGQTTGTFTLSGGKLTVGIKRETNKSGDWAVWDEFRLYYYGLDLSEFAATLAGAVSEAEALEGNIPTAAYNALAAFVSEKNKTYTTAADYTAATEAIADATNIAKALQANYSRYKSVRTAVLGINDGIDVSTANTAVEAATDNDGIDAAVSTLRNALATYLADASITDDQIDLTDALIDNAAPGITGNLDYWTNSGSPSLQSQLYEYWNVSGATTKQNIATELPVGYYTLTAIAYTRDNMKATLNAGTNTLYLVGCGSVNDRNGGSNWIAQGNGNGVNELTFQLTEATSNLEIGLTADATAGDHWMCWRSFQLKYLGTAPLVLFQQQLADAVTAANAHADALAIPAGIKSTYTNAISTAAAKNTSIEECLQSIADIEAATAAADAAVAPYAAYLIAADDAAIVGIADETISEQNNTVATATTAEVIVECTATLRTTISALPSYDITGNTITNATPTSNADGWTCSEAPNAFDAGNNNAEFWNQSAATMKQTITLPAGTYCLTVIALQRVNCVGTIEAAGKTTKIVDVPRSTANSRGDAKNYFNAGNGVNTVYFTLDSEQEVTIGINVDGTTDDHWTVWRSFTLTTYTEAVAASYLKPAYNDALAAAQAAKKNDAYENVTGNERIVLEAAIADVPEATIASYEEKTAALKTATATFTAAKTNYDIFATYNTSLSYADASKQPTITDESTAASIITALRAWFESNAMAEGVEGAVNMTSAIVNATDPQNNDGWAWTGNKNNPASNEPWTDADGTNNHSYFDGGNWSASSWTTTMSQDISLPAGRYLLTTKARAAENVTFTMAVGENTAYLPHVGSRGNVFDRGWGDASLEFTTDGKGVTILVTASTNTVHEWFSISDFRLMQLELNNDAYANADDYAALNTAIETAEAKTLGFEDGQYAPYTNAATLEALAAAKAIDQTAELTNLKADVEALTTALGNWTANEGDVDAIYNGMYATVAEGQNYPDGWKRTNNWGQMRSDIEGDFATAYYNQPGSLQYGNQGVYAMPLAANTPYKLTFTYRSHEKNSNNSVTASVLNDEDGLAATTFAGNGSTTEWVTATAYFTTGAAGNYVLTLANSGNTWMTNVSLVKAASATLALDEGVAYETTNRTYYETVNMTRTVKAGFNTVCLPFNLTAEQVVDVFGENAKVYTFQDVADGENSTINFNTKDGNTIEANVPVLIGDATASTEATINSVVLKSGEAKVEGTNFDFVGTYAPMTVAENDYFIGNGALYKSAGSTNIKGFRAYIKAKAQVGGEVKMYIDGDDATSINEVLRVKDEESAGAVYDLSGRIINSQSSILNGQLPKGIYIVNGKKVMVK